ncbi:MAG: AAA family ATPase, partial [Dehalococcoidia bacterium]
MDTLWPELEPSAAANNLHKVLHAARRTLGTSLDETDTYLAIQQDLVVLRAPGGVWTDIEAFQDAARAATESRDIAAYRQALGLYTGGLLPEDRYEDWAIGPRESLRDLYLSLLLEQAALQEAEGDLAGAIEALKAVITQEPAHETAHIGLMRLYGLTHQRHQGLRQFHKLRDALNHELDAEPGSESQRMYESLLEGESKEPVSPPPRPTPPTRYVSAAVRQSASALAGRGEELDRIEEVLDGLFQGSGGMLLFRGEAGVGKSRLTQEVLYRAASRDAHALWGAAYEQETQLPYGPFLEAFGTLPGGLLPKEIEALAKGQDPASSEMLAHTAAIGKSWEVGTPEVFRRDRQRLFLSVAELLSTLTGSAPVVLALDDLQAADEATLELLHFLARTHRDSSALFIGTFRPEDLEQAPRLISFLAAAQHERLATRMDVNRLGPHETESLVVSLLGPAPTDHEVFDTVFEFSEGNPFYAEEFVRSLGDTGDLVLIDNRWRLRRT